MAFENVVSTLPGGVAGADLSAAQFHCVVVNSSGVVVLAGDGAQVDGVLQNDPASGEAATVWTSGSVSKVVVGAGGLSTGDAASCDAVGEVNTAASGDFVIGRCLEGASAGNLATVLLNFPGVAP